MADGNFYSSFGDASVSFYVKPDKESKIIN